MGMRRENVVLRKRFIFIALFIALIAGISFGYAELKTTLSINGDTKIAKVGWNVHFKNLSITNGSFLNPNADTGNNDNTAVIDTTDDTKITFNVTLKEPGQFFEFSFDIANDGTLVAKLDDVRETGDDISALPYVTYNVSNLPAEGSTLGTGASNYVRVTIRVEFPFDIDAEDLPTTDFTFSKSIELDYIQNTD